MRLQRLDEPQDFGTRAKFAMMRVVLGGEPPDIVKTLSFRPDLWGHPMNRLTQAVMRGKSAWSVGEREVFAAWVSAQNRCPF